MQLNALVGYAADPPLYGRMKVWSLYKGWVVCELVDGTRERFREQELAPATQLWTLEPAA
jgi:hypothetical protein